MSHFYERHASESRVNRASNAAASRYLDGTYAESNPGWHEKDAPWKAAHVLAALSEHDLHPTSLCDIGCGTGGVLTHLARELGPSCRMVGYEPSASALELASGSATESIRLVNRVPTASEGPYDVCLALDVVEHVEDCFGFLRSLHGLARVYVFHIPLDMTVSAVARLRPIIQGRRNAGHLHYFCRQTAEALLEETEFEILSSRFTPVALDAPGLKRRTRIVRMLRRPAFSVNQDIAARFLGGFSLLIVARSAPRGG